MQSDSSTAVNFSVTNQDWFYQAKMAPFKLIAPPLGIFINMKIYYSPYYLSEKTITAHVSFVY